jgi:hypothetical protein
VPRSSKATINARHDPAKIAPREKFHAVRWQSTNIANSAAIVEYIVSASRPQRFLWSRPGV